MSHISVVVTDRVHHRAWANLFASGLHAHGVTPVMVDADYHSADTEIVCCWGWEAGRQYRELGHEVLVAERGYIGDRAYWTSLGWNGLNGRADFRNMDVTGDRWGSLFASHLKPWRKRDDGYALLLGQVPGDQSLIDVDYRQWLNDAAEGLRATGYRIRWRPHPEVRRLGYSMSCLALEIGGTLEEALDGAAIAVGYNSNSTLDAVLVGVPTITADCGAMAYDVSSHSFDAGPVIPDRTEWCHRLAYCQWSPEEIADGTAWGHIG